MPSLKAQTFQINVITSLDIKSRWYFKRNNLIIYFKNHYVFKMTLLWKIFAIISKTDFLDLYLFCLSCKVSKELAYSLQPMQTTNKHTGYTVQSSNDPSFRKSLAPKHENGGLECPSSLTESTAQASCLAVMRFGDYNSNGPCIMFESETQCEVLITWA